MFNILRRRYLFFGISLLIILPGLLIAVFKGLGLSVDFTGGTLVEMQFESGDPPQPAAVIEVYTRLGVTDVQVQTTGQNTLVARSTFLDDATRKEVLEALESEFDQAITVLRFESVGPIIGREVAIRAAIAIAVAALVVVLYITLAFRGIPHASRYGICAILAMIHDVAIVVSLAAIGSLFWGWQVNALFLTALLTVIGFSVQDKIVVFDRIRENTTVYRRLPFETLVNHSIVQTLQRSINTQLMTVEFMLLALALFGGITLREFAVVLLVGLFSGTYSSIFIAAPVLVVWENREWRNWFGGKNSTQAPA
ncbi:MAG TPA: protein translocase subunit SecF [Anaerolineales bacterium]|nr:protein translocase subunit SecF [Anaerolineales bacterium]